MKATGRRRSLNTLWPSIGKRLRARRELLGLTQDEVAWRWGMARTTLVHVEAAHQRCQLEPLVRLCRVLDLKPSDLLRGF